MFTKDWLHFLANIWTKFGRFSKFFLMKIAIFQNVMKTSWSANILARGFFACIVLEFNALVFRIVFGSFMHYLILVYQSKCTDLFFQKYDYRPIAIVVGTVASLFVIVGGCFVTWYCSCGSKSGNCIAGITGNSVLSFRSKDKGSVPAAAGLYSAR